MDLPQIPIAQLADHYKVFPITQGSKTRIIQEPVGELKKFQKSTLDFWNEYPFYIGCTARTGMSTLDNAAPHHGSRVIFKTDISHFYPSITLHHLLRNIDLHVDTDWQGVARNVLPYCLLPVHGSLHVPTGAPTSPILSNIAATDLDHAILEIANYYGFKYTRYIDDLTFSGEDKAIGLAREIERAVEHHGFQLKMSKTEWAYPNRDQKFQVTGVALLTERAKYRVPRELRRMMRVRLDKAALEQKELDKVTKGYLSYIRMIDRDVYDYFQDYLQRRKARYVSPS